MYKRDVAIVLLSCVALLVSLQNEGTFTFEKAWYHHTRDESTELYAQHHELPAPVVADLNGDGHLELVLTTPDLKLQVVQPQPPGHHGEGFARAVEINAVSLLFKRALVAAGRRPVALGVGYIDPLPSERVRPLRKQVIVVVTASWQVMCFDHNLVLLWEYDANQHFPHHARIKEVAVYISPHQAHKGDRGLIVVGASVLRGDIASGEGLEMVQGLGQGGSTTRRSLVSRGGVTRRGGFNGTLEADGSDTEDGARFFDDDDVLLSEMREDAERRAHLHSAGIAEKLSNLDEDDPLSGLPGSRHFSYVALEGGQGQVVWQHGSGDFHKDLDSLNGELQPQNNYRLDAEKLEGRHFGEASCREYRESVLHVLPHVWDSPADTRLAEAHFVKHRVGRGAAKRDLAASAANKGLKRTSTDGPKEHAKSGLLAGGLLAPDPARRRGLGATGGASKLEQGAGGPPTHGRGGAHAHSLKPDPHAKKGAKGAKGEVGESPKLDGKHPHQALHGSEHVHNVSANALVAYLEDGIEVLHLFSGRTVCKLHLPPRTLHADIDGDGVLDHISVYKGAVGGEGEGAEDELGPGEVRTVGGRGHSLTGRCTAVVRSGIPPSNPLYTIQVCRTRKFGLSKSRNVFRRKAGSAQATELATPVMLPIPDMHGYSSRRRQHGMLVFLTNKGEMTAANSAGAHLWQEFVPVYWPSSEENGERVVPTLAAMALYRHAVPTVVLAAGAERAAIVSEHGRTLEELELPSPPIQPLLVADFNGDGLNDIVLVTSQGVYGYVQVPHLAGGMSLGALLVTLVVALGIVYFTQHYDPMGSMAAGEGGRRGAKLRSTDYVD